jgi:hypothetical protein
MNILLSACLPPIFRKKLQTAWNDLKQCQVEAFVYESVLALAADFTSARSWNELQPDGKRQQNAP